MSMAEDRFIEMCEFMTAKNFGDPADGYYPTVEELKAHNVEENVEKYKYFLAFLANDPYADTCIASEEEYIETVRYCKKVINNYALTL